MCLSEIQLDCFSDSSFIVTWASELQDPKDTLGVYARRYNANGTPRGTEFRSIINIPMKLMKNFLDSQLHLYSPEIQTLFVPSAFKICANMSLLSPSCCAFWQQTTLFQRCNYMSELSIYSICICMEF